MENPTKQRDGLLLVLTSLLVLLQELIFIRWLPGQVRVLAYFPNLILISAFLGLGLGSLLANSRNLLRSWAPLALLVLITAWALSGVVFTQRNPSEHLWLLYGDLPRDALRIQDTRLPIVLFFILCASSFLAPGQLVAQLLTRFGQQDRKLAGYRFDILGSLLGIMLFTAISAQGVKPVYWFLLLACGLTLLNALLSEKRLGVLAAFAGLMVLVALLAERAEQYSPYYALSTKNLSAQQDAQRESFIVLTNGSLHQRAQAMGLRGLSQSGELPKEVGDRMALGYQRPYSLLPSSPQKVLILGAGTGNDVAVALQAGAREVVAVEIDPAILRLGQRHPDRPYSDSRVRVVNTDARAFLNDSQENFDLIVFATLDSMTRLSALSNVRLDNFVYTRESIAAARQRLAPNGGLVMHFWLSDNSIHQKLLAMLTLEFGEQRALIHRDYGMFNVTYLAGPAFAEVSANRVDTFKPSAEAVFSKADSALVPSDDWPFLYLQQRGISSYYLLLIGLMLLISALAIMSTSRAMRESVRTLQIDGEMFFFGAGFLLLESKAVTQMSLVWGATWLTSAVVFAAILAMILLSTLISPRLKLSGGACTLGVCLALALAYAVPPQMLATADFASKSLGSLLLVGLPVLFAGLLFAQRFNQRTRLDLAFGWNLLGAVCGGFLEFVAMQTGLKALYGVAAVLYCAAFLCAQRSRIEVLVPLQAAPGAVEQISDRGNAYGTTKK
jgi:spermidine synthase